MTKDAARCLPKDRAALIWDAERLRIAADAAGAALWSWNVDTDELDLDERACNLWGVSTSQPVTFDELSARIHPADRKRVKADFVATRSRKGTYEIDFRVLHGETIKWISARGRGEDVGIVGRVMFSVFMDVTGRRQAEESRELLAAEMSHRVKNLFSIAAALTAIAARSAATTTEMARDLTQRLVALGRAHDLVRPLQGQEDRAATLDTMMAVLLAPYQEGGATQGQIHVAVPKAPVGGDTATTLSLIIHELVTNSIKYGALSTGAGRVEISGLEQGAEIVLTWTERDGPIVVNPLGRGGFGSRLISQGVSGQLGGSVAFDWAPEGVTVTLRMNRTRLAT